MNYFAHTNTFTDGGHMWGMGMSMVFWLVFWIAIVLVIGWLLLRWGQQNDESKRAKPEDIAKERYAKGEINHTEYKKIIKDLQE